MTRSYTSSPPSASVACSGTTLALEFVGLIVTLTLSAAQTRLEGVGKYGD
jgi:hypothetical protein